MNTFKVLKGFFVLAIVLAGLVAGAPNAGAQSSQRASSMTSDAPAFSCVAIVYQQLQTVLPNGWSEAQACATLQAMGIPTQSNIIPVTGGQADPADPIACWHDAGASACNR